MNLSAFGGSVTTFIDKCETSEFYSFKSRAMKTIKYLSFGIFLSLSFSLISCEKTNTDQKGKLEFAMEINQGTLKGGSAEIKDTGDVYRSWHILLSVKNETGEYVMEDEIIPLMVFGDGYITGKIEMTPGKFQLTKFLVVGPEGNIVYAAPREGSSKAFLVDRPLSLSFRIRPGETTRVIPQVLPTSNSYPGDFGYASFGFDIVRPIIAYVGVVADNPISLRPNAMVAAQMTVFTPDGQIIEYSLEPRINKILLKPGYEYIHLIIEKPGYPPIEMEIETETLGNTNPDDPYIFRLSVEPFKTMILQPGPEHSKDAMITDLDPFENFGNYNYFEASFLSESPLTVMRTKRSLIEFDLSDLPKSARIESVKLVVSFEAPLWDSVNDKSPDSLSLWDNRLVFRQITEPWEEDKVTWENQPESIKANRVFIEKHPEMSSNQRIYDVTPLFVPVQEIAAPNHGFIFMHPQEENPTPGGLRFASSDYPVKEMRPKLVIKYSLYSD